MYHQPPSPGAPWRRRAVGVAVAAAALAIPAGLTAAGTEPAPSPDAMSYCTAHLALENALSGDDAAAIGSAVAAATEAAPAEIADALNTAIENAPTDGLPSAEFTEAYNQVVGWVSDNCGFAALDVLATEYAFGGLPEEVPSGPTVISLTNDGEEMHEMILVRKNDGVTASAEELLALPDDEAFAQVQFLGGVIVAPGEVGFTVADLAPGDYIALCFIPVGTTPDVLAQMVMESAPATDASAPTDSAAPGSEPEPHFAHGMIQEFTVTGDTIEVAGTAGTNADEAPVTTGA